MQHFWGFFPKIELDQLTGRDYSIQTVTKNKGINGIFVSSGLEL